MTRNSANISSGSPSRRRRRGWRCAATLGLYLSGMSFAHAQDGAMGDIETVSVTHAIHLASYRKTANVRVGWEKLKTAHMDVLAELQPRVETVSLADGAKFLRLIAGPFESESSATSACARLEGRDAYCRATRFYGARLSEMQG